MSDSRSGNWTIELRVYPIPQIGDFGGHMFWVLKDPDGNVQQEMHFFGYPPFFGPGSDLPFKLRTKRDIELDNRYMQGAIREPSLSYSAPREEILQRWQAGSNAGMFLRENYNFDYPSIWDTVRAAAGDGEIPNSNAGAYSIGKIMLPELVRKEKNTKIPTPGWGLDLFEYYLPGKQQTPDDTRPNMDVRPDFRNETRNEVEKRQAALVNPVQPASFRFVTSDDATVTPAIRALNAVKADDAFTKRYLKGDRDAVDRMHALHRGAYPEPNDSTVGPALRPAASDASADSLSSGTRDMTSARQALEAAKSDSGFVKRYLDGDRDAFGQMQSLIQAAYPEPDDSRAAADGSGAQRDTAGSANAGFAPWLGDALAGNALRDEGTDPTLTGWLDSRR